MKQVENQDSESVTSTREEKPKYIKPAVKLMDEAEALSAFQVAAAGGGGAGTLMWWVG